MVFSVKFWGARGSIPTPGPLTQRYGGNTPCVEIRCGETLIICDAGSGLRELGFHLRHVDAGIVGHLFISHAHWDHIQGFPFFSPLHDMRSTFYIYGGASILALVAGQMSSPYFPVEFSELRAHIAPVEFTGGGTVIDQIEVCAFEQNHPDGCLGFSFAKNGRKVVYATDTEIDQLIVNQAASAASPEALRLLPNDLIDRMRGSELLIADGQYSDLEYLDRVGWGHSRATTAVDMAAQAGVKQLWLFSHDPMQSDLLIDEKVAVCRRRAALLAPGLKVYAAQEGVEVLVK